MADEIWRRLGDPSHYVEPFFGGGATLLLRPGGAGTSEVVNDLDCMIPNFWRAVAADPEAVALHADWPISEADLLARHRWLVDRKPAVREAITTDPEYFDPKVAGWWVWGISQWIGSGWCREEHQEGPRAKSLEKKRPRVTWATGVNSVSQQHFTVQKARGVNGHGRGGMRTDGRTGVLRSQPGGKHSTRLGGKPAGINGSGNLEHSRALTSWFLDLQDRMRRVRTLCGDFERTLSPGTTSKLWPVTGVFLDPPYNPNLRTGSLYNQDSEDVAVRARRWALEHGDNPKFRIVLAGYPEEHSELEQHGWKRWDWSNTGGMNPKTRTESLFCSPHCLDPDWWDVEGGLFSSAGEEATC